MASENKVELIVDDVMEYPDLLEEDENDQELNEQLVVNWGLNLVIYAILVPSKWTGHEYELRNKLVQWPETRPESKLFEELSGASLLETALEPKHHNMQDYRMYAVAVVFWELFASNNGLLSPRVFAMGEPPVLTAFYVVADKFNFKYAWMLL